MDTANISEEQEHGNIKTEDINSLFDAYRGCSSYKILIEGEPGIGKTILSSEIAAQWANSVLLEDKALLLLLFMRQPETKSISNVKSLVEHFFHDDIPLANEITEWLIDSNGKHLTILLDGYDEASTYSLFFDFVNKLILCKTLPECGLVITSRPAESLHLHDHINCRAEILGFTEQSRQQFMKLYIEKQEKQKQIYQTNKQDIIEHNIKKKIEIIQKVLKHNPIINTLCYIPLNATMLLLCLTQSEEETDLPTTTTSLYERFIIITMKRFLRTKPGYTDTIFSIKDLPNAFYQTFQQLSNFAFSASIDMDENKYMQLVFELADIEANCENFISHGYGLGLLKPASFLNMGIQNRYSSYNFLHKSIQEYMAAYHIASLPSSILSNLLNKKFWNSNYFNIWVMYIGITGGEQKEFRLFLSGSRFKLFTPNPSKISNKILNDKIKCLHLLRCLSEAQESKFLGSIQNIFEGKIIDLSNKILTETDIKVLAVLLLDLPGGPWTLNLSGCNINNKCCKVLFETFASQTVTAYIKTVNISFNSIYSENLYRLCHEIFKLWKTEEVILPIDALNTSVAISRIEHFMNIVDGLIQTYQSSSGKLMILYQANQARLIVVYSDLKYVKCFQLKDCDLNENTAKRLKISVTKGLKSHRIGHIYFSCSIYKNYDVDTLSYIKRNFKRIKFCGLNMHSKGVYLLDNVSEINLQIESDPLTCLVDFLAAVLHNNAQVSTSSAYLSMLSEKIREETKRNFSDISTIKVLDMANNNLSDCLADDIELILSCNKLEEVYLGGNNLQEAGMTKIAEALQYNSFLKVFDISSNHINSKAVITAINRIANILAKNTQLEELYLGENILQPRGIFEISLGLQYTSSLKVFDISNNDISIEGTDDIVFIVSKQVELEKLILNGNDLQDGLIVIINELKCHGTLKLLDISDNNADIKTMDKIAVVLSFQTNLEKLYLGGNNMINTKTLQALQYFLPLTTFDISRISMADKTIETLSTASSHVAHMQALLLIYHTDFSVAVFEHDNDVWNCRVPLPTAGFSDIVEMLKSASKCVYSYLFLFLASWLIILCKINYLLLWSVA